MNPNNNKDQANSGVNKAHPSYGHDVGNPGSSNLPYPSVVPHPGAVGNPYPSGIPHPSAVGNPYPSGIPHPGAVGNPYPSGIPYPGAVGNPYPAYPPGGVGSYPGYPSPAGIPPYQGYPGTPVTNAYPQPPTHQGGYVGGGYPQKASAVPGGNVGNTPYPNTTIGGNFGVVRKPLIKQCLNFDPIADIKKINKAFKGIGCDDKAIMVILTNRSMVQRTQIRDQYDRFYGSGLFKRMKSELHGDHEKLLKSLILPSNELDAYYIRSAIKHIGTDELCVNELLNTRSNQEIQFMIEAYIRIYNRDIFKDIKSDTSGSYADALQELLRTNRKESLPIDPNTVKSMAQDLNYSCKGLVNSKNQVHTRILCLESFTTIRDINREFEASYGMSLQKHISKNFVGDMKNLLIDICDIADSIISFFVGRLMTGLKNLDLVMICRVIVTRMEIDLLSILEKFEVLNKKKFDQTLKNSLPEIDKFMYDAIVSLLSTTG